jgi:PilZ domain
MPRYPVRQGITVKAPGPALTSWGEDPGSVVQTGRSRDISEDGIFFWVEERIVDGSEVEVFLGFPPELSNGSPVHLRCKGKVVRIERERGRDALGVAVAFSKVEVVEPGDD